MKITVGELKRYLNNQNDDDEIIFGCPGLEFERFNPQLKGVTLMEFNYNFWRDKSGTLIVHEIGK